MEKEDYQWVILALGLLLVIGLIIKPVVTHKEPNFGLPALPALPSSLQFPTPPPPLITTQPVTIVTTQPITTVSTPTTPPPTTPPVTTPVPGSTTGLAWNGSAQTVGFVDPSTYNVSLTTFVPRHSEYIPQFSNQSNQTAYRTVNYTSIISPITGKWSGTTQVINIPPPYWEIWYTVEPTTSGLSKQSESSGSYVIQPVQGEGVSRSGVSGSYSTTVPFFSIDVIDADNPSRFIKTITPPGTLDPALWTTNDPRPWKEKIFEGNNSYYLVITARYLNSYSVDIKVPNSYIPGKI